MPVEQNIGALQRFLGKIQRALAFKRNPVQYEQNKARMKARRKVLGCIHL